MQQVAVSPESYLYGQNVAVGTSGKKDDEVLFPSGRVHRSSALAGGEGGRGQHGAGHARARA